MINYELVLNLCQRYTLNQAEPIMYGYTKYKVKIMFLYSSIVFFLIPVWLIVYKKSDEHNLQGIGILCQ